MIDTFDTFPILFRYFRTKSSIDNDSDLAENRLETTHLGEVDMASTRKKISIGAAATTLTGIALAMGVPTAEQAVAAPHAHAPTVNADTYTLACQTLGGKEGFSPHVHSAGGAGNLTIKLTLKWSNCTAQSPAGGQSVTVSSVQAKGMVSIPNNGCSGLIGTFNSGGTLTKKVKTVAGTSKLTDKEGTISFQNFQTSVDPQGNFLLDIPGGSSLPAVQSSGPFSGGDGGASTHFTLNGGPYAAWQQGCASHSGLKHALFGDGSAQFG